MIRWIEERRRTLNIRLEGLIYIDPNGIDYRIGYTVISREIFGEQNVGSNFLFCSSDIEMGPSLVTDTAGRQCIKLVHGKNGKSLLLPVAYIDKITATEIIRFSLAP